MLPVVIPLTMALSTFVLRILSPAFVLFTSLSLLSLRPSSPGSSSPITSVVVANIIPRRAAILSLLSIVSISYFLDGAAFVVYVVYEKVWPHHTGIEINSLLGVTAFAGLAALGAWKDVHGAPVWTLRRIKLVVALALLLDLALVVLLGLRIQQTRNENIPHIPETPPHVPVKDLLHFAFPAFRVLLLIPLLASLSSPRVVYASVETQDSDATLANDSTFLLPSDAGNTLSAGNPSVIAPKASKYGTFRDPRSNLQASAPATRPTTPAPSTVQTVQDKPESKAEISLEPDWSEIWRRLKRLTPYLWPSKSRYLQLLASFCVCILLVERVVNVAVPLILGLLVDILEGRSSLSPWIILLGFVCLRFLQGSGGLAAIRDSLWAPVMQYSDREMSQLSFDHILNLSFAWHTRRKTGEILRVLDRGAAINHTLELILFNIIPTFIDIFIALIVFCILFDWQIAAVIFLVMIAYVYASVTLTRYRTRVRRQMNDRDVITRGIHTDCLLNYETVKYFSGEEHEGERYREAIREYQALEYKVIIYLNLLNLVQNFIITLGLLGGSFMVAYRITQHPEDGSRKFVSFITYLTQLYGPLNQLGYIYRSVNQSLVDTERLLALLNEPSEVNDKENAPDLAVTSGEIEFDNVSFSYDYRTTALNGVSFKVPKGSSVALVGESGSGKSTILRLLYRFYDLREGEGRILIDGQDIRDVTQRSLRQAIGVVPQDPILFNSTIGYNIGYGKIGATPEEIEEATKSAQMHDRIMSFPDGYNTKTGERGVRLSGGEKQRVAIARTLLKNPPILLLDEATSALDTSTEKDIQKALQNLVQGRSSLSIAHRLSTIISADLILVLKEGQVVEQGTFKELLAYDGLFASMWADQVSATEDPAVSLAAGSVDRGVVLENSEDDERPVQEQISKDAFIIPSQGSHIVPSPKPLSVVDLPSSESALQKDDIAKTTEGVSFPSAEPYDVSEDRTTAAEAPPQPDVSSPPLAFPTSPEPERDDQGSSIRVAPAVTFGAEVNSSRIGTPDLDSEPKRKRISSQNFQRLARRISVSAKRQGSSMIPSSMIPTIPGLMKRDSSPRVSVDDSNQRDVDSATGSIKGDDKGKKKKDKKDKTRK
ncbi:hypothetical protein Agabi119p4_1827 [Agaricus bisporus var. burnettii]|uniref:Mitochondrial half-size ABC transporter n=1 Tax=Agaricus bisporus var. burnettii TaxID=192524 RepID=A0A8H7F7V6_AGABI|nr:hypothetical protein Agabi119p4_1827 [Agaricus bisporus var. burnettii]